MKKTPLDKKIIASRLQEINEGLTRISGGLVEAHYRKSKKFGAAARICSLIRGRNVIKNYESLVAAAGELGIGADTLEKALSELEKINYVTLYKSADEIQSIEERIPLLSDRFEAIGELWMDSKPSDFEKISIEIIDDLMLAPQPEREIIKKNALSWKDFQVIKDVGITAAYYRTYKNPKDGSEIGYSPLYCDENPEKIVKLMEKFPSQDISKIFKSIREYQGKPVEIINDPIICEAIRIGCIPTPTVDSTSGRKSFAFTPLQGVDKLEKTLLEKARAIVACVRYGEHFAGITRIHDPLAILEALRRRHQLGSHSEAGRQYALLVKLGIGRIARDTVHPGRFVFHLIDSEENMRALDFAIQYLTVKEITKLDRKEREAKQLLLPGIYGSTTKTRMEVREAKPVNYSETSINRLNHLIIGGSSDI